VIVHATVVARFFAGGPGPGQGYGHFGGHSLFVIQQVLAVDQNRDPQLDSSDTPEQPQGKSRMQYLRFGDGALDIFKEQQQADSGARTYAFADPQQVALDLLVEKTKTGAGLFYLHAIKTTSSRIVYEARATGSARVYRVVVSRQAWLAFYAKDPAKVIWAVIGAFQYGGDTWSPR